jgi:branched-chain amino acid transport system ATP-binding protein
MENILVVDRLQKNFGRLEAVRRLSFDVREKEILGIMGPNGAGKTTVFNLLSGILHPDAGTITFRGEDITHESPAKRCHKGIGRTYQIPRPFDKLSVYENLLVGAVHGGGLSERGARERIYDILEMLDMVPMKDVLGGGLSLLYRKKLELGRALATQPRLILLDEVAGGLTEKEGEQILETVKKIWSRGVSIVWIEHILMMMFEGVHRLLCISEGEYLCCGHPKEVMESPEVLECYLGAEEA